MRTFVLLWVEHSALVLFQEWIRVFCYNCFGPFLVLTEEIILLPPMSVARGESGWGNRHNGARQFVSDWLARWRFCDLKMTEKMNILSLILRVANGSPPVWCRWLAYLPLTQDTRVRVPVPELLLGKRTILHEPFLASRINRAELLFLESVDWMNDEWMNLWSSLTTRCADGHKNVKSGVTPFGSIQLSSLILRSTLPSFLPSTTINNLKPLQFWLSMDSLKNTIH